MPLTTERPPTDSRQEFCLALKAARERRGIALREIAEATKIPASLFAALERGDLRRWPKGLFRRSFFRDYVRTIGGSTAELCDEFVRLFPDDDGAASARGAAAVDAAQGADDLRLALDAAWRGPRKAGSLRLLAAGLDAALVLVVSTALAWAAGIPPLATIAIVAMTYFTLGSALFGASPATCVLGRRAGQLMHLVLEWAGEQPWRPPIDLSLEAPPASGSRSPRTRLQRDRPRRFATR